jgi:hypothetical protein
MSTVCPACGVAVIPGYVRCPKCHAGLAPSTSTGRLPRLSGDPGGTALPQTSFPIVPVLVGLVAVAALIVVFGVRGGGKKTEAAPEPPTEPIPVTAPGAPQRLLDRGTAAAAAGESPVAAAQDVTAATRELEGLLRRLRLWGRGEIAGSRIDVRSGSCADPAMRPAIESKTSLLRGAGLTKLRCLEQSGAVVFERDL